MSNQQRIIQQNLYDFIWGEIVSDDGLWAGWGVSFDERFGILVVEKDGVSYDIDVRRHNKNRGRMKF